MKPCPCGSYAINPSHHGRDPKVDLDLCDVCYWRKRAEKIRPCHYCGGEGVVDSGGSPPWDYHVLCPACKPNLR